MSSGHRSAGQHLNAVALVPGLLDLVQHAHRGQDGPAGHGGFAALGDGPHEVRRDELGVLLLRGDVLLAVGGVHDRAALVDAVAVAVGHGEAVVDVLPGVVGAGDDDGLVVVRLDDQDQLHRDAGALVDRRIRAVDAADAVVGTGHVPTGDHPEPDIDQVSGVVPQQVVGPG